MLSQLCGASFPGVNALPPEVDGAGVAFGSSANTKGYFDPSSRLALRPVQAKQI